MALLPAALLFNKYTRKDFGPLMLMAFEVSSINFGLSSIAKNTVNRTRPLVYNPNVPMEHRTNGISKLSFYSGHTSHTASMSFFMAKVLNDYHPNMKPALKLGMWTAAALIPAATGYYRVKAGKHFPTDVMTGYAIGAFTGWLVPHLHKKKALHPKLSIYPTRSSKSTGMALKYKF